MIKLTTEELKVLIQVIGEVAVPVKNSGKFVELINKLSKMVDESKVSPVDEPKKA